MRNTILVFLGISFSLNSISAIVSTIQEPAELPSDLVSQEYVYQVSFDDDGDSLDEEELDSNEEMGQLAFFGKDKGDQVKTTCYTSCSYFQRRQDVKACRKKLSNKCSSGRASVGDHLLDIKERDGECIHYKFRIVGQCK